MKINDEAKIVYKRSHNRLNINHQNQQIKNSATPTLLSGIPPRRLKRKRCPDLLN